MPTVGANNAPDKSWQGVVDNQVCQAISVEHDIGCTSVGTELTTRLNLKTSR